MKQIKRILAIIGIVLLLGLYIATFIIALSGNENINKWFIACIFATVGIPVFLWAVNMVYKKLKGDVEDIRTEKPDNPEE